MSDEELFKMGLYKICEALHMSANGSSDPLPDATRECYVAYLVKRVNGWHHVKTSMYDDAMWLLVHAALDDAGCEAAR